MTDEEIEPRLVYGAVAVPSTSEVVAGEEDSDVAMTVIDSVITMIEPVSWVEVGLVTADDEDPVTEV